MNFESETKDQVRRKLKVAVSAWDWWFLEIRNVPVRTGIEQIENGQSEK